MPNGELTFKMNDIYPNWNTQGTTRTETNIDSKDNNLVVEDEKMVAKVDVKTTETRSKTPLYIFIGVIVLLFVVGTFINWRD